MPERFERECGFTRADWERCLPEAVGSGGLAWLAAGDGEGDAPQAGVAARVETDTADARGCAGIGDAGARVAIGGAGRLTLRWRVLPDRRIALMRMPRLGVTFTFDGCSAAERREFLRRFDRVMQRGGG